MRSIKKDFFGNQVLTDISFTLREGEVLGLVGENGAGKSTLMKILFGMDVIRETGGYGGDVLINGEKVTFNTPFDALAAGIGMVHQEFSLIPGFTATENILLNREPQKKNVISEVFGSRLNTLDYKEMDRSAAAAIEKMGVHIDANMVISDMPVGHKQFTEIARELSKEHLKLLILDEPTAVLTEKEAAALLDSIRSMSARGIAVIFITHRLQEILDVCDKVIVMRDGHVVKDTPAKETNVSDITRWMVGRSVELSAAQDVVDHSGAKTIMSIRKLWVDMPGEIVRNVDLDIREGEILGIGGLVGAGRSELVEGIFGMHELASGEIFVKGKQVKVHSPKDIIKEGVALITEDRKVTGLNLSGSVNDNIAMVAIKKLLSHGLYNKNKARAASMEYIKKLNIKTPSGDQITGNLSGGNQQKIVIAKWLLNDPDIIILDEPTRGIDVGAKRDIYLLLGKLVQQGKAVIMISSEIPELMGVCDRIMVMCEGNLSGEVQRDAFSQERIMTLASAIEV